MPSIAGIVSSSMHWLRLTVAATSVTAVWSQPLAQGGSNPKEPRQQNSQVDRWQFPDWIVPVFSAGTLGFFAGRRYQGRRGKGTPGDVSDTSKYLNSGDQQTSKSRLSEADRKELEKSKLALENKSRPPITAGEVVRRDWKLLWMKHCTSYVVCFSCLILRFFSWWNYMRH